MSTGPVPTAAAATVTMITACAVVAAVLIMAPAMSGDLADAKSTKKIHFTRTLVSTHDPGVGHQGHQIAMLLLPQGGVMYDGSVTYAADRPVQVAVLHEIDRAYSAGQPVWTVDGNTVYALSLIGDLDGTSDSVEFTGAALALHSTDPDPFVVTASVDGWIRGGAADLLVNQTISVGPGPPPSANLFRTSVPAVIPLHNGVYGGDQVLYIITDSSDESLAKEISQRREQNVTHAPALAALDAPAHNRIYFFKDGVYGQGLYGFQADVLSSIPVQDGGDERREGEEYGALRHVYNVSWKPGQNAEVLDSIAAISAADRAGRIRVEGAGTVLNAPQVVWPGGQMQVREGDDAGGQILGIDRQKGTVTFVAHRGWGPDGQTVYHIITDATPQGPARMMGVPHSPALARLAPDPAVMDIYQFKNGLVGSGALGFQPGVAETAPDGGGDRGGAEGEADGYTPTRRVVNVEWNRPDEARLLQTVDDINAARADGLITVSIARPFNDDHVVNRPSINPFR